MLIVCIKKQLKTLVLSDVIDYMVKGSNLLVITKAKPPAMVNRLVKFSFEDQEKAGNAIEVLHEMVNG